MMDLNKLRRRDLEKLSAYLDGQLSESDAHRVESRIQTDAMLRMALQELANTRKMVSELPSVRPPRNFTLTPEMAGIRREVKLFPVFRFATVIATAAFAVLVGADALFLRSTAGIPLASEPARLMAEEAADFEVAVEEVAEAEGMLEAPMEDAVIGAAADDIAEADRGIAAPEALPLTTEGVQTPREPSLQGFGTETGAGLIGEETKVEPTGTVLAEGTQEQLDGEQSVGEEPTVEAPALVEPVPLQEIEPTPVPIMLVEPRPSVDPLRIAEIGLGTLALLSAAITFILRKAR
jgi:hypothetical protein